MVQVGANLNAGENIKFTSNDNGDLFINATGGDGKSAYEIAVEEGFVGTVDEWLASLYGKDGMDGKNGIDGADGAPGLPGSSVTVVQSTGSSTTNVMSQDAVTKLTTGLPWCTGTIADRALTAATNSILTPVYANGNLNMVSGNTITFATSGIYSVHLTGGYGSTNSDLQTFIAINATTIAGGSKSPMLANAQASGRCSFPSVSCTSYFSAGDFITFNFYSLVAQASVSSPSSVNQGKFTVIKLR